MTAAKEPAMTAAEDAARAAEAAREAALSRPVSAKVADELVNRCPNCGERVQEHSLTWWCLRCGWARNKPGTAHARARTQEARP